MSGRLTAVASRAAGVSEALVATLGAVSAANRQGRVLEEADHRPWPLPAGAWFMAQTWEDLLFAHWRVPQEQLRPLLPPEIPLDTFDGSAWVGVTPFCVSAFRLRGLPHVPGLTRFAETNVRTYATLEGKPGIFFLSLDAASAFAVIGARRSYRLPYFRARMRVRRDDARVDYRSSRVSRESAPARLEVSYRPLGDPCPAAPGTLEHFLAERYCLYTTDEHGTPQRADIHHPPWPLQRAEAAFAENTMASPWGLELEGEPLLHFSARQDVVIWPLSPLEG